MPLDDFTFTVAGNLGKHPQAIRRDEVTTLGMSVLGPRDGPFDLSIDSIEAVNIVNEVRRPRRSSLLSIDETLAQVGHHEHADERLRLRAEEDELEPVLATEQISRRLDISR